MKVDPIPLILSDVLTMLEKMDWPAPAKLAHALDLRVISGPVAAINLNPPPTIHLPDQLVGFRRMHTLAHEIAHALLAWREINDELLAYYAPECAYSNLEALANHIAGLITMPPPIFEKTMKRFGFGPQGIMELATATEAPLPLAMDRVIYDTDTYQRAALLFKKGYVIDYATTMWLEIEQADHVPEPEDRFPGITLLPLPGERNVVLGTWGW